jgi:hypothetical protein
VELVDDLNFYTNGLLWYAVAALRLWALVDCLTRRSSAFPAVDKLTKPAWVAILLVSGLLGTLFSLPVGSTNVVQIISLASIVAACVYLADVRPAVREISGGR